MIGYDLGMHQAGVLLGHRFIMLMLVIVFSVRAIEVNRLYLRSDVCQKRRNCP